MPQSRTVELRAMVAAYQEAAEWSSTDGEEGTPIDSLDLSWSAPALAQAEQECASFASANAADLAGMDPAQAGHDLWLTRNHHGAGFWDRGLGERGDRLTAAAHAMGECCLYVGDDRLLYLA